MKIQQRSKLRRQWAPTAPTVTSFPLLPLSPPTPLRAVRPYQPTAPRYMQIPFSDLHMMMMAISFNTMRLPPLLLHPSLFALQSSAAAIAPVGLPAPSPNLAHAHQHVPVNKRTAIAPPVLALPTAKTPVPAFLCPLATNSHSASPIVAHPHSLRHRYKLHLSLSHQHCPTTLDTPCTLQSPFIRPPVPLLLMSLSLAMGHLPSWRLLPC